MMVGLGQAWKCQLGAGLNVPCEHAKSLAIRNTMEAEHLASCLPCNSYLGNRGTGIFAFSYNPC